jgi:peptidoglycan-N-acetylglucosamine deacetylase
MTKTVYLTIDDAPSADFLNKLDFLEINGICAVWFCQGNLMEQRPHMIVEAIRRGHIIGNHTYSHPSFSDLTLDQCYAEIRAADAVLQELYAQSGIGISARYFRFPYGDKGDGLYGDIFQQPGPTGQARREAIQHYLRRLGYTQPAFHDVTYNYFEAAGLREDVDWHWTFDTLDWGLDVNDAPHGINTAEKMHARMDEDLPEDGRGLNYPHSADIVLIHDHQHTADLFTTLIEHLITKNVRFEMPVLTGAPTAAAL